MDYEYFNIHVYILKYVEKITTMHIPVLEKLFSFHSSSIPTWYGINIFNVENLCLNSRRSIL